MKTKSSTTSTPIIYRIQPSQPAKHRFIVSCTVNTPELGGQKFALPAWIPGSYLIRDFARHIVAIRAEQDGHDISLQKIDTHTWQAAALKHPTPLTIHYEVYAWDISVRGAQVDEMRAFFNGSSVFLQVIQQEHAPCLVNIQAPAGAAYADWRIATALTPSPTTKRHRFGDYCAANYDELIDHPVEMGIFALTQFKACGITHEIAIAGQHDCDLERLTRDLQKVCEWQIRFFGEPAPMKRYVFLVHAVGEGYGGLEHRASTALLCSRNDLPYHDMQDMSEQYRGFLGLCSHEYFHTWHVKRIKPAAFLPYDLTQPNHTRLLWVFEGFTSYYDDLALLRSGVITQKDWLALTEKTLSAVQRHPSQHQQSLSDSSFDAWSKFYRPDENSPNAVVSYYSKGALAALAIDLTLREKSQGKISLDDVMRTLWTRYGKHAQRNIGLGENELPALLEEISGIKFKPFFADYIDGTSDIQALLKKRLARFGIRLQWQQNKAPVKLSIDALSSEEEQAIRLKTVYDGGAAQAAGLSSGDLVIAVDGLRVTPQRLEKQLERHQAGDVLTVHAFRRDELISCQITLRAAPADKAELIIDDKTDALCRKQRQRWLGG